MAAAAVAAPSRLHLFGTHYHKPINCYTSGFSAIHFVDQVNWDAQSRVRTRQQCEIFTKLAVGEARQQQQKQQQQRQH
jgi:hypothetical protein